MSRNPRLKNTTFEPRHEKVCQEIFLISQEIFKEKQDINNEA
jgi:hypothetical protein